MTAQLKPCPFCGKLPEQPANAMRGAPREIILSGGRQSGRTTQRIKDYVANRLAEEFAFQRSELDAMRAVCDAARAFGAVQIDQYGNSDSIEPEYAVREHPPVDAYGELIRALKRLDAAKGGSDVPGR